MAEGLRDDRLVPTVKELVAQAKREYPRDKVLFRARLDQLLTDWGHMKPLDDRPSVSLAMAARSLQVPLGDLLLKCKTNEIETVRGRSKGGNRTYRIPTEVFERLKEERHAETSAP